MARPITLSGGGVPDGTFSFRRMSGSEELGRPFAYELQLDSADDALALAKVVGQGLTVALEIPGGAARHFHGLVTGLSHVGWEERRAIYLATLRPSLWLLTRRAGCRIFQAKTVPEILRAVMGDYGFPLEVSLSGTYPAREYVVQYRESDFDFVSRLMEQEGITYFFRHETGKHTLVLADASSAHQKRPGYEEVPYYPPQEGARRERDHVEAWSVSRLLGSGAYALRDYDFQKPRASLEAKRSGGGSQKPELEIYDYPGGYTEPDQGERYVRTRLEELVAGQERCEGSANARGLATGFVFKLTGYPRKDLNKDYLIVAASCDLALQAEHSGGGEEAVFGCRISAQDAKVPFRSPRVTPRPVVHGPQTARVVGKAGEEIWTDAYGRVKVEFHWDRASPGDEQSSCWVRVAQAWSGATWGAVHIPRIGQEVVVQFLDGDPDRPVITGHLHNEDNKPSYPLPANQTRSGFKSRSTKGGTADNANEIRFEDKKGDEQLYLQAEKNYDLLVKNDASADVGHDETRSVKHDRSTSIGNDETVNVGANRTESVGKDESVTIGANRTLSVGKDESISVGGQRAESVAKDASLSVQGRRDESIGKDLSLSVTGERTTSIGKGDTLQVGKALLVSAADEIVLEAGSAKIVLKKNGDILLEGAKIKLSASGTVSVQASGAVSIKGSEVKTN